MPKRLRKAMSYLGLVEDEESDEMQDFAEEKDNTIVPINSKVSVQRRMEKIVTVHPKKYDDAKTIGQAFRNGVPVIINLSNLPEVEAKRIIDFASGLVFGLQGKIKSVAASVFLLSPHNIAVGDEYDAISAKDDTAFYNQI